MPIAVLAGLGMESPLHSLTSAGHARCPADRGWARGNRPVINVTQDGAHQYAWWLFRETGSLGQGLGAGVFRRTQYPYTFGLVVHDERISTIIGRSARPGDVSETLTGLGEHERRGAGA